MNNNVEKQRDLPILYLVVPCYNEEDVIEKTATVMREKLNLLTAQNKIQTGSKILFVNDGSKDKTACILQGICKVDSMYGVINLAGNAGHQNAILAGMMFARKHADVVVTIDADLQQDIEALDVFLAAYRNGAEVVYGVRNDRHSDGFLKKTTATCYYKLLHFLGNDAIANHADYRLMSKLALDALAEYKETNLYLRGLIPTMGFPSDIVYFDVKEREAGQSKYTFSKMMKLATDGVTSMSVKPLHMISGLGFFMCLFSMIMIIISLVDWVNGKNIQGYTTMVIVTLLVGGITILSLGVIGEYIGKIYMETKGRPRYVIESVLWKEDSQKEN